MIMIVFFILIVIIVLFILIVMIVFIQPKVYMYTFIFWPGDVLFLFVFPLVD